MEAFYKITSYPLPKWAQNTYEELDKTASSLMYSAEKNVGNYMLELSNGLQLTKWHVSTLNTD